MLVRKYIFEVCRLVVVVFACVLASSIVTNATQISIDIHTQEEVQFLYKLDLFKGTNQGFELDRAASRVEAIVMLIRLLGEEKQALDWKGEMSFTDVPEWAIGYVGYAYEKGYSKGLSSDIFGSDHKISAQQFLTLVNRSLNYTEVAGDFSYQYAMNFAMGHRVITEEQRNKFELKDYSFTRKDCVNIMYKAITVQQKNSYSTILQDLIMRGTIDFDTILEMDLFINKQVRYNGAGEPDGNSYWIDPKVLQSYFPEATDYAWLIVEDLEVAKWKEEVSKKLLNVDKSKGFLNNISEDKTINFFSTSTFSSPSKEGIGVTSSVIKQETLYWNIFLFNKEKEIIKILKYMPKINNGSYVSYDEKGFDLDAILKPMRDSFVSHKTQVIPKGELKYTIDGNDAISISFDSNRNSYTSGSVGMSTLIGSTNKSLYDMNEDELHNLIVDVYIYAKSEAFGNKSKGETFLYPKVDSTSIQSLQMRDKQLIFFYDGNNNIIAISGVPLK